MQIILPVLILAVVFVAVGWWIRSSFLQGLRNGQAADPLTLLQNQVHEDSARTAHEVQTMQKHLGDEMRRMSEQMSKTLTDVNRIVGDRLDNTAVVIGDIRQRLGQLDEASRRILETGKDIAELQQTLKAPKLRGSMGEYMLSELLAQVLPENSFKEQYRFKGGESVDAIIRLNAGIVSIDAKFPLENFRSMLNASSDEEKHEAGKLFRRDVKKHINDISVKYIRVDEGTFDFAMMYIPAENVYYEIVAGMESDSGDELFGYALNRHVIPVSPNSFYAYLQTILLGLKGMKVEETAREIMGHLARLAKELGVFTEEFRLVGQHMNNAAKKYSDAEKRLGKVESKIEEMSGSSRVVQNGEEDNRLPG